MQNARDTKPQTFKFDLKITSNDVLVSSSTIEKNFFSLVANQLVNF